MPKIDRYMMATTAQHQLGDISSDDPDICHVHEETETDYIGSWVTGLGFINVKFPKETTRELTEEEILKYEALSYQLADNPLQKLEIRGKHEDFAFE